MKIILILLLAFLLRFFLLGSVPPSLDWDEASLGYNAFSLLKTGSDEFGTHLPITLRSFGDFKPAGYAYAALPAVALLGLNEFSVRLPSALAGLFSVLALYLLVSSWTKKSTALLAAFFLAVSPWSLQFSRAAFEANLALCFFLWAICLFKKNLSISLLLFAASFYTYHSFKILVPASLAFLFWQKRPNFKPVILMLFLLLPLFLDIHRNGLPLVRANTVSVFSHGGNPVVGYLQNFSPDFLFLKGDSNLRHHSPNTAQMLLIDVPLLLCGFLFLFKKQPPWIKFLLFWLLISPLPSAISIDAPHALRSLPLLPPLLVVEAYGLMGLLGLAQNKKLAAAGLVLIYLTNVFIYFQDYFLLLPKTQAAAWQYGYKQLITSLSKYNPSLPVYVTKSYDQPYIYFLFYTSRDPNLKNPGNFSEGFANYKFTNFQERLSPVALYVTAPKDNFPLDNTVETITDPNGSVVFRLGTKYNL